MLLKIPSYFIEIIIQLIAIFFITVVGNWVIKWGFKKIHEEKEDDGNKLGRHIGNAERLLLCYGIISSNWEVVTAIVALKALSRFKEMDNKTFAEYFFIGSSWSLIYCLVLSYLYENYVGFFSNPRIEYIQRITTEFFS